MFLLLLIGIQDDILYGKPKGKRMRARKVIVLVPDVNVFDIVLDPSEETSCQTQKWWLFESTGILLLLWAILRWLLFIIVDLVSIISLFHLFFFHFYVSSDPLAHSLAICSFLLLLGIVVMSLGSPDFMDDAVHKQNVSYLILDIVLASFRVLMKMLWFRHLILVRPKNEMDVTQLHFHWFWKEVPHTWFDVQFTNDSCFESIGHVVLVEKLIHSRWIDDGIFQIQFLWAENSHFKVVIIEAEQPLIQNAP